MSLRRLTTSGLAVFTTSSDFNIVCSSLNESNTTFLSFSVVAPSPSDDLSFPAEIASCFETSLIKVYVSDKTSLELLFSVTIL